MKGKRSQEESKRILDLPFCNLFDKFRVIDIDTLTFNSFIVLSYSATHRSFLNKSMSNGASRQQITIQRWIYARVIYLENTEVIRPTSNSVDGGCNWCLLLNDVLCCIFVSPLHNYYSLCSLYSNHRDIIALITPWLPSSSNITL